MHFSCTLFHIRYLICVFIDKSLEYSQKQDSNVEADTPVLYIEEIQINALSNGRIAAKTIYLCPSGHARAHLMLDHVARNFFLKLLYKERTLRSRTDQAHVTL